MSEELELKVKSVKKFVEILNCFIEKQPLGVTEISEKLQLAKANVSKIISSLVAMEYLEKDTQTGKYYLGIGALRLGQAVGARLNFAEIAVQFMQQLSDDIGIPVFLAVPIQGYMYVISACYPGGVDDSSYGRFRNTTIPLHVAASGKAVLAHMPESKREKYLSAPMRKYTENTITDPEVLRGKLEQIRIQGYATEHFEFEDRAEAVGVPITSKTGEVIAGICASWYPEKTKKEYDVLAIVKQLKSCAMKIETYV